jgi:hypothetical protein
MFIGLLIGIVATRFINNWAIIPLCMVASLVPDMIDKPISFWYLEYNSGRTVAHTLLFIGVVTAFLLPFRHAIAIWAITVSLFVHGLLDAIWKLPTTWFYPYFGPFLIDNGLGQPGHWFWSVYKAEITSPVEWLAGIAMVLILGLFVLERGGRWQRLLD